MLAAAAVCAGPAAGLCGGRAWPCDPRGHGCPLPLRAPRRNQAPTPAGVITMDQYSGERISQSFDLKFAPFLELNALQCPMKQTCRGVLHIACCISKPWGRGGVINIVQRYCMVWRYILRHSTNCSLHSRACSMIISGCRDPP